MRMLVVIRKNWGGNRTESGARAQAILTSVLCTARQQDKDVFELLTDLLRSRQPKLLAILPKAESVTGSDLVDAATGGQAPAGAQAVDAPAEMSSPGWADLSVLPDLRSSPETGRCSSA